MTAIDIHAHAFPDEIAERAISKLEAGCPWKAVSKGTIKALLKSMDRADIDVSVVCPIATRPDESHVRGILDWCHKIRDDRIEPLPSVHPKTPGAAGWVNTFADDGFVGIKLHPMYQDFEADDPAMDPVYAAAARRGLMVVIHCGKDIAFPPEDDRAAPVRMRRVLDRHAGLKLIATHMGGWRDWEESAKHLVGTEAYLETSFSLDELGPRAVEMMRKHGIDRVLFGTDWPWQKQDKALKALSGLGLDEVELRKITFANAAKLIGY